MAKKSAQIYRGQRNKERRLLFDRFGVRCVELHFKAKFFALFGNRCFICGISEVERRTNGEPPMLCIDHHVPMALGGHLVPGNLVALCRRCNERKLDEAPEKWYSSEQLCRLKPLLHQQHELFDFAFDWDAWNSDRESYLFLLGLKPALIQEVLYDELSHLYEGLPDPPEKRFVLVIDGNH